MKKMMLVITSSLIVLLVFCNAFCTVFADKETRNNLKGCTVSGCHHTRKGDSLYCRDHKCAVYECMNRRTSGDKYCSIHKGSSAGKTLVNGQNISKSGKSSASHGKTYKSSTGKKKTYNNSYDEGYEDIWLDDDYDWDRYWQDDKYAMGVDDAMEDEDW